MRHPASVVGSVAASLAMADITRRSAERDARERARRDAAACHAVGRVGALLAAAHRREQHLEDEIEELEDQLLALRREFLRLRKGRALKSVICS
jgi:hypothetical protein